MTIIDNLIEKEYINEDEQIQLILYISMNNYNKSNLQNIIEVLDAIIEVKNKITIQFNDNLTNKLNNYIDFLNNCKEQCNIFISNINKEIDNHLESYNITPNDIQEVKLIKELYKNLYIIINELDDQNENIISNLNNFYGEYFIFIIKSIKILLDNIKQIYNKDDNCKYNNHLYDSLKYAESIKNNDVKRLFKIILYKLNNKEEINKEFENIFNDMYRLIFDNN